MSSHDRSTRPGGAPAAAGLAPRRTSPAAPGKVTRTQHIAARRRALDTAATSRSDGAPQVQSRAASQVSALPPLDEFGGVLRWSSVPLGWGDRVQMSGGSQPDAASIHSAAAHGISGSGGVLPHLAAIQSSFGPDHDVSRVRAHVGGKAAQASQAMGAQAYTTGQDIGFADKPDLHLAAHEAAHTVQQQAGLKLAGGVGRAGDPHEAHADAVADRVVAGKSAADLLAQYGSGGGSDAVQNQSLDQTPAALAPESRAPADTAVQLTVLRGAAKAFGRALDLLDRSLRSKKRKRLRGGEAVDVNGLIDTIHTASVAERQNALNDAALHALITARLDRPSAQIVMSSLLEGSQKWKNPRNNDFYRYFTTQGGAGTLPTTSTMNCWESILYAAYLAKLIDAAWIASFYGHVLSMPDPAPGIWAMLGFSLALPTYAPPGSRSPGSVTPSAGQLLFYHTGRQNPDHISVSLGGDQSMSLWHRPNHVDSIQRIGVTELKGTVYVGNPPW